MNTITIKISPRGFIVEVDGEVITASGSLLDLQNAIAQGFQTALKVPFQVKIEPQQKPRETR